MRVAIGRHNRDNDYIILFESMDFTWVRNLPATLQEIDTVSEGTEEDLDTWLANRVVDKVITTLAVTNKEDYPGKLLETHPELFI